MRFLTQSADAIPVAEQTVSTQDTEKIACNNRPNRVSYEAGLIYASAAVQIGLTASIVALTPMYSKNLSNALRDV